MIADRHGHGSHGGRLSTNSFDTPPHSTEGDGEQHDPDGAQPAPQGYMLRRQDWFKPGRLFSVWEPNNEDRHRVEFVLLDTRNIDGNCLMVEGPHGGHNHQEPDGNFLDEHIRVRNWAYKNTPKYDRNERAVYLSKWNTRTVDDNTWVHLERMYNVPFARFDCCDHGILDRASLVELKKAFLYNLADTWDLRTFLVEP